MFLTDKNKQKKSNGHESPVADLHEGDLGLVQERVEITPWFSQSISATQIQRHIKIIDCVHRAGLPTKFLGYHPVFSGHQVIKPSESETDWVLMNLMNDPLFTELGIKRSKSGTLYVPEEVRNAIGQTLNAGIDFDSIFIAHEIPKDIVNPNKNIDLKTLLPPPPPNIRKKQNFRERSLVGLWNGLFGVVKGIGTGIAGIGVGAVALATTGLDPILFGVNYDQNIISDGKPVGMFYYITHWRWK